MEATMIVIADNSKTRLNDPSAKPLDSSIKQGKSSLLIVSADEKDSNGKCEHFSIRGFVSETRKKNWKMCWPFATAGDGSQYEDLSYVLPPLHVPKFKFWGCESCLQEIDFDGNPNNGNVGLKSSTNSHVNRSSTCSDAIRIISQCQQAQKPGSSTAKSVSCKFANKNQLASDWHLLRDYAKDKLSNSLKGHCLKSKDCCFRDSDVYTNAVMEAVIKPRQKTCSTDNKVVDPKSHGTDNLIQNRFRHPEEAEAIDKEDEILSEHEVRASGRLQGEEERIGVPSREVKVTGEHVTSGNGLMESPPYMMLKIMEDPSTGSMEILERKDAEELSNDDSIGLPSRKRARKVRLLTDLLCGNDVKADCNLGHHESRLNCVIETHVSHAKRWLGHCKKRKPPQDEEWKPVGKSIASRVRKSCRKVEKECVATIAGSNSEDLETAFAKMSLQFNENVKSSEARVDDTPSLCTIKKQKTWVFAGQQPSDLLHESDVKDCEKNVRYPIQGSANYNDLSDSVNEVLKTKEMDLFPLSAPGLESEHSQSKMDLNNAETADLRTFNMRCNDEIVRESSVSRKGVDNIWTGSLNHPFLAADSSLDAALNLSLNSYMTSQNFDLEHSQQLAERRNFSVACQASTSNDPAFRNISELRAIENLANCPTSAAASAGRDSFLGSKRIPPHFSPFVNEKQNYTLHVQLGNSVFQNKGLVDVNSQRKKAGIQDAAILAQGTNNSTNSKGSEHGGGDFPIEIVELMAQNQYERRLPDHSEYHKVLMEVPRCSRNSSMIDFSRVHIQRDIGFPKPDKFHKQIHGTKGGRTGGLPEPTVHNPVGFFPLADLNKIKSNQKGQAHSPVGFRPFSDSRDKPSSGFQNSASSPVKSGSFHPGKWNAKASGFNFSISSSTSNSYQQNKDSDQMWPSISANQMPVIYGFPQAFPSSSLQPRFSECQRKDAHKDKCDLVFLNQTELNHGKHSRSHVSETSDGSRVNDSYGYQLKGVDAQKKSLDLYSNDTIPAMHLLSLMDAGAGSSAPPSVDRRRKALKSASNGPSKMASTSNRTPKLLPNGNKQQVDAYVPSPDVPKSSGRSTSSLQHDRSLKNVVSFSKMKDQTKSCMETNHHSIQVSASTSCLFGSNHFFCAQEMFPAASNPVELPFESHPQKMKNKSDVSATPAKQHQSKVKTEACSINRNPADFTFPDEKSDYMISGEDLKFERMIPICRDKNAPKSRKRRPKTFATGKEEQFIAT